MSVGRTCTVVILGKPVLVGHPPVSSSVVVKRVL